MRLALPLLASLTALALVAGCGTQRPQALACPAFGDGFGAVAVSSQGTVPPGAAAAPLPPADVMTERAVSRAQEQIETVIQAQPVRPGRVVTLNVVALSAGGQYGAFGAGFMTGWSANTRDPRPVFDLVTGVSAGATQAPAVFAGSAFDGVLGFYNGLDRDGILRLRNPLAVPFAPSLGDPAPLQRRFDAELRGPLLGAMRDGHDAGRALLIAATNIDNSATEIFDLGAAAGAANAAPCIREAVLASAAIPALFPPRNINGALYADGGLRQHVFFPALEQAVRAQERGRGIDVQVNAFLVLNGALVPPDQAVDDDILSYVRRSVDTLADEVLRDSIAEAVRFSRQNGWRLRGIRAAITPRTCAQIEAGDADGDPAELGGFDACVTEALFEHGQDVGSTAPIAWLTAQDLLTLAEEL